MTGAIRAGSFKSDYVEVGRDYVRSQITLTLYAISGATIIHTDEGIYVYQYSGSGWSPIYASTFSVQSTKGSKENFSSITDEEALNLLKIPPQHFDYINGEKNQSGFIAEDVEPFFPEICSYQKDEKTGEKKLFGLDYSKFSPYIIKLLQVQEERIERLEGQFKKEKIT